MEDLGTLLATLIWQKKITMRSQFAKQFTIECPVLVGGIRYSNWRTIYSTGGI